MAFFQIQNNVLSLLHYQHRLYTSELAKSHRTLSKLYKKLEKTERGLSDWKERGLKRKDKKRLQWDRAATKAAVKEWEAQQALLHDYLGQCSDHFASYSPHFFETPAMPWAESPLSPTAHPFAPGNSEPPTPWTAGPFEERATRGHQEPQYWDLSMLRERQSPLLSRTPYSGFDEPLRRGVTNNFHSANESPVTGASGPVVSSNRSSFSEKDTLTELVAPSSPAKLGAEGPKSHRRRYSENAIQMIEARLGAKEPRVESVPPFKRTVSETMLSKE